jgi:hypothetical protein
MRRVVSAAKVVLLLPALVAATASAAGPAEPAQIEGAGVRLGDGGGYLVAPALVIDTHDGEAGSSHPRTLQARWRVAEGAPEGGFAFAADLADEPTGLKAALRLERGPNDAAAALTVEVAATRAQWAHLVAIDLPLPGPHPPTVIDRTLHPRAVEHLAFLDRFGPKEVRAGDAVLLVDDGIDGAVVKRDSAGASLRIELFSVEERPFRHDSKCARKWRAPNARVPSNARLLVAGDKLQARVTIAPSARSPLALEKSRFPDGRRAALLFTDHADQSSPATLAALALGRSDAKAATGGLLGHHLAITKSLFLHGDKARPALDDPRVAKIADELSQGGVEIIPHSATPKRDLRRVTDEALDFFSRYHATTWIDHQPETNCEAFSNQGFRGAGPYRIADLLEKHGYRYLWAADDNPPGEIDLTGGEHFGKRAPTLYPLGRLAAGDPDERWLFRSTWMFIERKRLLAALGRDHLDHLERERGLAILHTYLETLHKKRTRFGLRNLFQLRGNTVAIDPGFDALLADLQRRVERGTLWVPTLSALGDWLRALERVNVAYEKSGAATVSAPLPIHGLTFLVPRAPIEVRVDGQAVATHADGNATRFSLDLAAGKSARVELVDGEGKAIPFL